MVELNEKKYCMARLWHEMHRTPKIRERYPNLSPQIIVYEYEEDSFSEPREPFQHWWKMGVCMERGGGSTGFICTNSYDKKVSQRATAAIYSTHSLYFVIAATEAKGKYDP